MQIPPILAEALPTTLAKWAATLGISLAGGLTLLPAFVFAWLEPTPDTVRWLAKSTIVLTTLLSATLIAMWSIVYQGWHQKPDLRGAIEDAKARSKL